MNRRTCLKNTLRVEGFPAYRELLRAVVVRKRGDITRIAFELGMSRRHMYRCLMFANLWDDVVAARALPHHTQADPLARALAEL